MTSVTATYQAGHKAAQEYLVLRKEADVLAYQLLLKQQELSAKGCELTDLHASETFAIIEDGCICKFTMDSENGGVESIEWIELLS